MNPYYDAKELGLKLLLIEDPGLSYEFDMLVFWATPDGKIYSASDSGCSCPTPFEEYCILKLKDLDEKRFDRVGSLKQAEQIFKTWNDSSGGKKVSPDEKEKVRRWIKENKKK